MARHIKYKEEKKMADECYYKAKMEDKNVIF